MLHDYRLHARFRPTIMPEEPFFYSSKTVLETQDTSNETYILPLSFHTFESNPIRILLLQYGQVLLKAVAALYSTILVNHLSSVPSLSQKPEGPGIFRDRTHIPAVHILG